MKHVELEHARFLDKKKSMSQNPGTPDEDP